MKTRRIVMLGVITVVYATSFALPSEKPDSETQKAAASTETVAKKMSSDSAIRRAALEKQFKESLTGAVLEGIWQVTGKGGLKGNEPLSEPRKERYTIAGVEKAGDEHWIISARIEYGDTDVTVPVLVRVIWAGDTPVVTIDDLAIPLIGAYSARVIFHHGFYSGIWYSTGKNYGGILSGRIIKKAEQTPPAPNSVDK